MLRSKEDMVMDKIFRNAYGNDYTWDSANQQLAKRKGVGKIEDGPSKPKANADTGQIGNAAHQKVQAPTAQAAVSVAPANMGNETMGTTTLAEANAQTRALSRARAYINSNS